MNRRFKKIYIEITNICNLHCEFCAPDNRPKETMTLEMFQKILEEIKPYTRYIYLHVKGEPLLHPEINEFIHLAKKKGFLINVTTNGTKIRNLQTKEIRQLNYSMQSTKDIEEIRKTIQIMREYIKETDIYLSLRLWTDASKENIALQEMLKKEFKQETLEDKKALDKNIFLSIENQFDWPDKQNEIKCNQGYCYGLKDHVAILVDGTVVPCCLDHKGEIALGNIKQESLKEILEKERTEKIIQGFRNREVVETLCKSCNFKNRFE